MQLTATLRNLADLPPARRQLLCSGAVSELCAALEQRVDDKDVCVYIVRIFRYVQGTVLFLHVVKSVLLLRVTSKGAGSSTRMRRFTLLVFFLKALCSF